MVVALDLATTTGWCAGHVGGRATVGSWTFSAPRRGERFTAAADAINDLVLSRRPAEIAFEAPLPVMQRTYEVAATLWGLAMLAEYVAARHSIRVCLVNVGEARRAVLGTARIGRQDEAKAAVDRLLRAQGHRIDQPDARDAFVVWKHRERAYGFGWGRTPPPVEAGTLDGAAAAAAAALGGLGG